MAAKIFLLIFFASNSLCHYTPYHSDPQENVDLQFNSADHIPGEPLSPMDYQNAETYTEVPSQNDGYYNDPIEIAGLFEGDIVLPGTMQNESERNAIINQNQMWSDRVIPYFISAQFNPMERSVIAKAFLEYHKNTCLVFRPRTTERDYIHIVKGNGCSSHVGRTGGGQTVTLGQGCVYTGIAIHELMHVVGFWHEQSRWDRDEHVTVYPNNIVPGMEFNFQKYNWHMIQNLSAPYDTGSVMHYGPYAFSKNRQPTMLPKNPGDKMGQREHFSKTDLYKINKLYKCNEVEGESTEGTTTPSTSPTSPTPTESSTTDESSTEGGLGQGKCSDSHKNCAEWAKRGECTKNPAWMNVNCKNSCNQCNAPCKDQNKYCTSWATKGECTKNRDYMKAYCAKACSTCGPEQPSSDCTDNDKNCKYWATNGECKKNPKWMSKNCKKACGGCSS